MIFGRVAASRGKRVYRIPRASNIAQSRASLLIGVGTHRMRRSYKRTAWRQRTPEYVPQYAIAASIGGAKSNWVAPLPRTTFCAARCLERTWKAGDMGLYFGRRLRDSFGDPGDVNCTTKACPIRHYSALANSDTGTRYQQPLYIKPSLSSRLLLPVRRYAYLLFIDRSYG